MKRNILTTAIIFLLAILSSFSLIAQVPEGIVYQAEARDQNGKILKNKFLEVEVNILQGSANGALVWQGIHEIRTDKYGLITLTIGEGASSYNFSDIDWAHYVHFLNVRINNEGNWTDLGTMQFISVPYAIHSQTTEHAFNADEIDPVFVISEAANISANDITNLSNLSGVNAGDQDLSLSGNTLALTGDASSVDMSAFMDNTDAQQLSIDGVVLSLDNSVAVELDVDDADADPGNELITGAVLNGGNLEITDAGGTKTVDISGISSPWHENGAAVYYNSGNVGIGTESPDEKLDVNGNIKASSIIAGNDITANNDVFADNYNYNAAKTRVLFIPGYTGLLSHPFEGFGTERNNLGITFTTPTEWRNVYFNFNLPDGAFIREISFNLKTNSGVTDWSLSRNNGLGDFTIVSGSDDIRGEFYHWTIPVTVDHTSDPGYTWNVSLRNNTGTDWCSVRGIKITYDISEL